MATGDKIYLADKGTLDTVKTTTDNIKVVVDGIKSVADSTQSRVDTTVIAINTTNTKLGATTDNVGTFSVFSYLKNILNNITTLVSSDKVSPKAVSPSKVKYGLVEVPPNTNVTVFNTTTPGNLYSVLISGVNNSGCQLRITVDGTVILYLNCNLDTSSCLGLVVGSKNVTYQLYGTKNLTSYAVASGFSSTLQNVGYMYSPLPVRVNSSLLIEVINTTSINPHIEYSYIED